MIGDNAKEILMEGTKVGFYSTFPYVNLALDKLQTSDIDGSNPLVVLIRGQWHLEYDPYDAHMKLREFPYRVVSEIINNRVIRVTCYEDLMLQAKNRLDVARYVQWSDVNRETFELAKQNPSMKIPTLFNLNSYLEDYRAANHCKNVCLNPARADEKEYQE